MMARMGKVDFSQLKAYRDAIATLNEKEMGELHRACAKRIASVVMALATKGTPVGQYPKKSGKKGGKLRRGWGESKDLKVYKSGNAYTVEVINPVEYASYVEFGHRKVGGGWQPGQFMLTIAAEDIEGQIPKIVEQKVLQKIRRVFSGKS